MSSKAQEQRRTGSSVVELLTRAEASRRIEAVGGETRAEEFAAVRNLGYSFSPVQFYPLAPRATAPLPRVAAFAVDMDGTSTTTEPLALHALEYMVRRCMSPTNAAEWSGLDATLDYPHVIGNSNFRHAEFLVDRYRDAMDASAMREAFAQAAIWTLANMPANSPRGREVRRNLRLIGWPVLLRGDAAVRGPLNEDAAAEIAREQMASLPAMHTTVDTPSAFVTCALDIYYMRYHAILMNCASQSLRLEATSPGPMPGYGEFFALAKGWLGSDAAHFAQAPHFREIAAMPGETMPAAERLRSLGEHFEKAPAKIALVTASIAHEAELVMRSVMRQIQADVAQWPVSTGRRHRLEQEFARELDAFDAFVTANDAHEGRLKPHPDLYGIALFRMGLLKDDYPFVVGLEDTEPGIISLRAAGVGCAVALPNHDTAGQRYAAAARVVHGGLPEFMLRESLMIDPNAIVRTR